MARSLAAKESNNRASIEGSEAQTLRQPPEHLHKIDVNEETKEYLETLPPSTVNAKPVRLGSFATTNQQIAEEMAKYESNLLTSGTFDQYQSQLLMQETEALTIRPFTNAQTQKIDK